MRRITLFALAALLLVPAGAQAGGWATVELGEAPTGIVAGTPWRAELIVKQHGVTPLDEARPTIRIAKGGDVRTFRARHVGPGRYVAEVTYPSAGTWRTRIYDGWTDASPHRLAPMSVAPAWEPPGGFPWEQTIAIAFMAMLWIGGWIAGYGLPAWSRKRSTRSWRRVAAGSS